MANFTDPIKAGFGYYLQRFHADLIADTRAVAEFADRPFAECAVWAPGRLIDQVDEMLAAYRKNDNAQAGQPRTRLPIMIAATAKDFLPAPPEFGRGLGDAQDVTIPHDPKERVFRMRAVVADVRTQVVIIAADDPTARSIALQLHAFTSAIVNRRFSATYQLAGLSDQWPVMLENPDLMAMNSPTEAKNITMLVLDVTLRATVPLLSAPKRGEDNDGQGGANAFDPMEDDYDPSGYLVVTRNDGRSILPPVEGAETVVVSEWVVATPVSTPKVRA